MKHLTIFAAGATLALANLASAQLPAGLDIQVVVPGASYGAANDNIATVNNVELDGVAVYGTSPVNVYAFESENNSDQLFLFNGTAVSVFATEAQIGGGNASAGDLAATADGTLYASIFNGSQNVIWNIPSAGFGSAVQMTSAVNLDEIAVDALNSRLIISFNDAFSSATENVVTVPLNANGATPTVIATETDIEAVLATITGYVDDTSDDLNISDLTVQSDGDIIISHGFGSNRQINGSLLRITSGGAVSVFATGDQIITWAGGTPATTDIGNLKVNALSDDQIIILAEFISNETNLPAFIGVVSADGTSYTPLATEAQCESDTDVTAALKPAPTGTNTHTLFFQDSKSTNGVAANDDYYFFRQGNAVDDNAVLALTGVRAFLDLSAVEGWEMFE